MFSKRDLLISKNKPAQAGFTLVELLAAMLVSGIVMLGALRYFVDGMTAAREDRQRIADAQILAGVLQTIAEDIRMAGEKVPEETFPVIEFDTDTRTRAVGGSDIWTGSFSWTWLIESNQITIRRAILKPLTLCQNLVSGAVVDNVALVVASEDVSLAEPACRAAPLDSSASTPLPRSLQAARNYRCESGSCISLPLLLSNRQGQYNSFSSRDEQANSDGSFSILLNESFVFNNTVSARYPIGSAIYIVEERKYALDNRGNLNLYLNGQFQKTITSDLQSIQFSAAVYVNSQHKTLATSVSDACADDNRYTCKFSPSLNSRWKDIAKIRVRLVKKYDPTGRSPTPSAQDIENLTSVSEISLKN